MKLYNLLTHRLFCMYSSVSQLEKFTNLKVLILDHNNLTNMRSFPAFSQLETLSLAYNTMRDLDQALIHVNNCVSKLQ